MRVGGVDTNATTQMVSAEGFSAHLATMPKRGEACRFVVHLPDGTAQVGEAVCKNAIADLCGFSIQFERDDATAAWEKFIAQEEATGSLWRMIGRYTHASPDGGGGSAREVTVDAGMVSAPQTSPGATPQPPDVAPTGRLRFHTVGENGEAYRVLFERFESTEGVDCDLAERITGFADLAARAVLRVLDDEIVLRFIDDGPALRVRVCEQRRGGYAYIHESVDRGAALVSLAVGELILIEIDGEPVHPYFSLDELERIACDTFRSDMVQPMFAPPSAPVPRAPEPITFATPPPIAGVAAVQRAQQDAAQIETRSYGERTIELFPQVWARANIEGAMLLGPVMRDKQRALLLVLVGPGAPRVLRLDDDTDVSLLGRSPTG